MEVTELAYWYDCQSMIKNSYKLAIKIATITENNGQNIVNFPDLSRGNTFKVIDTKKLDDYKNYKLLICETADKIKRYMFFMYDIKTGIFGKSFSVFGNDDIYVINHLKKELLGKINKINQNIEQSKIAGSFIRNINGETKSNILTPQNIVVNLEEEPLKELSKEEIDDTILDIRHAQKLLIECIDIKEKLISTKKEFQK